MEKKNFVTLVLGTIGGFLFAIGMCMCLLPEWNMFETGLKCGGVGLVILLIKLIVYRRLSGKAPIRISLKVLGKALYGAISALVLGAGMSMVLAFEGMMMKGIVVGIVGLVMLLFLIPMCVGLKDSKKQN